MFQSLTRVAGVLVCVLALGCAGPETPDLQNATGEPPTSSADDGFTVKLETSKGDVLIEVHPEWAPHGAQRFRELVEAKFYDDCKFFRVLKDFMAQTGVNGDPNVHAQWKDRNIPDDPVKKSNERGYVTFAKADFPNSRSTQFFINYQHNPRLDGMDFAPFGVVVEGMDVVDSLYKEYGEGAPHGTGPAQQLIVQRGNSYLEADFPKLDAIQTARIISESKPAETDDSKTAAKTEVAEDDKTKTKTSAD